MSRALGVDYGARRVGLSLSDEGRLIAQPFQTLPNKGDLSAVARELVALAEAQEVTQLVVGWPLRLNGKEGLQTRRVERFIEAIERELERVARPTPIELWDERLSTTAAERALIEGGVGRRARRDVVDQVAASVILQAWLDAQRAQINHRQTTNTDTSADNSGSAR